MKPKYILIGFLGISLLAGGIYFFITQQTLKTYNIDSSGNEPTIPVGSVVIASNLYKIEQNDFIVYERDDPIFGSGYFIHRLIVKGNDTLLIKDGTVFVNGEKTDENLRLQHRYIFHKDSLTIFEKPIPETDYFFLNFNPTSEKILALVPDDIAKKHHLKRYITKPENIDKEIFKTFGKYWTSSNFGPYLVPKEHYFVMGDNRDNSMDSRFFGPIPVSSVVSSVKLK